MCRVFYLQDILPVLQSVIIRGTALTRPSFDSTALCPLRKCDWGVGRTDGVQTLADSARLRPLADGPVGHARLVDAVIHVYLEVGLILQAHSDFADLH